MQEGLLLLEDIVNLGRKGEVVRAKPGFAWNYLLPQKKAVMAGKATLRLQEQLRIERAKQAAEDEKHAHSIASRLKDRLFVKEMKSDVSGHLYGSVTALDLVKLLKEELDVTIDRRSVILPKPIKKTGVYTIKLVLQEQVPAACRLKVKGDKEVEAPQPKMEVIEEEKESAAEKQEKMAPHEGEERPDLATQEAEVREELEMRTKNEEDRPSS